MILDSEFMRCNNEAPRASPWYPRITIKPCGACPWSGIPLQKTHSTTGKPVVFWGVDKKEKGRRPSPSQGFSLVETVVYAALLGAVALFAVDALTQIGSVYQRARVEQEALSQARTILETVARNSAQASAVYAPTSRLNNDAGQLSLVTHATSTSLHANMYTDFWVDGGMVFERQEGGGAFALSANSARVSMFRFERIVQSIGHDGIKMTIRVDAAAGKFPASVTLNATAALRGNY